MALLLVFPDKAFGFKHIPSLDNTMAVGDPALLQSKPTAISDLIPPYLRKLSDNKAE